MLKRSLIRLKLKLKILKCFHNSLNVSLRLDLSFLCEYFDSLYLVLNFSKNIEFTSPIEDHAVKISDFLTLLFCLLLQQPYCFLLSEYFVNQRLI